MLSRQGVIPQISLIMGPCAGGDVYSPAMTDFIFMVRDTSYMYVTGPDVVKTVTNEVVTHEELGGASVHTTKSSIADGAFDNDVEALLQIRRLIDFLPANNVEGVPEWPSDDPADRIDMSLDTLVPGQSEQALRYERGSSGKSWMKLISLRYPRSSRPISSPALAVSRGARSASSPTSRWFLPVCSMPTPRARRLASCVFCDAFEIPIITFEDVPGFLPGTAQEYGGLIKHGAKLLFAYSECTVPLITIITRKAYGGAYDVMASKHIGGDINYAWPSAQIAVMGAKGARRDHLPGRHA